MSIETNRSARTPAGCYVSPSERALEDPANSTPLGCGSRNALKLQTFHTYGVVPPLCWEYCCKRLTREP